MHDVKATAIIEELSWKQIGLSFTELILYLKTVIYILIIITLTLDDASTITMSGVLDILVCFISGDIININNSTMTSATIDTKKRNKNDDDKSDEGYHVRQQTRKRDI